MRLKQGFNKQMLQAVQEYHLAQRDSHVRAIRWVCDPEGYALLLVRFKDEDGRKYSSLMSCDAPCGPDDGWSVDEVAACPSGDEHCMVQTQMLYAGREVAWEPDEDE